MIKKLIRKMRNVNASVMGINARNLTCIYPLNPRRNFPKADSKLLCKKILGEHGIPHPATLAVYNQYRDLLSLEKDILSLNGLVIKPGRGYGGRGILVLERADDDSWKSGDEVYSVEELRRHIYRILTGCFSLEKVSDSAFIEELIVPDETFCDVAYRGLPDIRIIVYGRNPLMAMARIPTRESGGLANLHQGGVGLGIDLKTGVTTRAVYHNSAVTHSPDTNKPLIGIQIPFWEKILEMASLSSQFFGLGYLGMDIVLDRFKGPMVIEVNARPGLNIQLANAAGLTPLIIAEGLAG